MSLTGRRFSIATLGCMQEYSAEVVGVTADGFYPDSLERFKSEKIWQQGVLLVSFDIF